MKTCLGSLLLLPIIFAIVGTAVYHTSVNGELRFEQRDSNEEYINTNRSYRPRSQAKPDKADPAKPATTPNIQDDVVAEEVES